MQRSATECNGVQRSGTEWNGVERSATEWNGVQRSGTECNGVERSATEWNGVERSATEWNGVQRITDAQTTPPSNPYPLKNSSQIRFWGPLGIFTANAFSWQNHCFQISIQHLYLVTIFQGVGVGFLHICS